jgi:hypothetical protein
LEFSGLIKVDLPATLRRFLRGGSSRGGDGVLDGGDVDIRLLTTDMILFHKLGARRCMLIHWFENDQRKFLTQPGKRMAALKSHD